MALGVLLHQEGGFSHVLGLIVELSLRIPWARGTPGLERNSLPCGSIPSLPPSHRVAVRALVEGNADLGKSRGNRFISTWFTTRGSDKKGNLQPHHLPEPRCILGACDSLRLMG